MYIYDNQNKKYLDLVAGVSACSLGHGHPNIVQAVINQDEDQDNDLQAEEDRRVIPGLLHVQVLLVGVSFVQYFEDLLPLRSIERLEVPLHPRFAHI